MGKKTKSKIDVWREDDFGGIEFRSGIAVKEPYPKHWHEEYQFCFIEDGGGELSYRGVSHNTPKISLFIVHPGEVHSNSTETGCSFRSIYVQPDVIEAAIVDSDNSKTSLPFFPDPIVFDEEIIEDYLNLHFSKKNSDTRLEKETALIEMLAKLIDRYAQEKTDLKGFGKENKAVEEVRDYINDHYNENISLKKLSELVGLSQFHLNRVFSQEIGMPPHAFQTQVRIAKAKQLIRKGFSLSDIAVTTGFADQSHFNRHFKRLMKITPSEY